MLVDTHCHIPVILNMQEKISDETHVEIRAFLNDAQKNMVTKLITIATTESDSLQNYLLAERYAEIYASIGLHPNDHHDLWRQDITHYRQMLRAAQPHTIVAIGECGIDLYHKSISLQQQRDLFRAQIELALEHNLPLVIHSRDAADETFLCLDEFRDEKLRGVVHCFSYDISLAHEAIQRNFVIGLGGAITYPKNEMLRIIATEIPLSAIVLETDAPFLPPQPWRGKPNHPRYIQYIAQYIAELRHVTLDVIAAETTTTAERIFTLAPKLSVG